jgi:hypothetical protein
MQSVNTFRQICLWYTQNITYLQQFNNIFVWQKKHSNKTAQKLS